MENELFERWLDKNCPGPCCDVDDVSAAWNYQQEIITILIRGFQDTHSYLKANQIDLAKGKIGQILDYYENKTDELESTTDKEHIQELSTITAGQRISDKKLDSIKWAIKKIVF